MLTQEYMQKVVEDVDEDDDFNSEAWVSATNYVNAFGGSVTECLGDIDNFLKKGKLEQVVAIVKSCSPNMLGDLNVTLKDLSGTIPEIIHYKVLDVGGYGYDITVGAATILANVYVFTPKPSHHYLNITMRNVIEVFRKDTVFRSEKDDAKPPISTDTFGSNGGNDSRTSSSETPAKEVVDNGIESEVVVGLPEEFQKGDMVDALSRVEQKKGKENQLSWQHLAAIEVEKLPMELQLKNNFWEALEIKSKDFEKKMINLNLMLYDL
ncbi:transposase, MuDR, MULE transposase domain protein [Tanacetum coccineum]